MDYLKGILSAIAAIFITESVFFWPFLRGSKATGILLVGILLVESLLSFKFWIVGVLAFGVFFAASRATTILRVLFFWIPTVAVSALGFVIVGLYTWLYFYAMAHTPQIH